MIYDGYTIRFSDYAIRPVAQFGRMIAREYLDSRAFDGLEKFLWGKPHFIGDATKLTLEEKLACSTLMLESDCEGNYENLVEFFSRFRDHPLLMMRPCTMCHKYWFDQETGEVVTRGDKPALRPDYSVVSCETHSGCIKGHHEDPITLSPVNQQVVRHFLQYVSAGPPDLERSCPIVQRNWSLLKGIYNEPALRKHLETLATGFRKQRNEVFRVSDRSYTDGA
jgi:hypothetical protein